MDCGKCNHQNDALSVNCINCGNDLTQKSLKNIEAEINHYFVRSIIFWGSIVLSVWIFQNYKHLFFKTDFEFFNWYEFLAACIWGGFVGLLGKKIGDYMYGNK